MVKSAIQKSFRLNASGILFIDDDGIGIENPDNGELIKFTELLSDFADKTVEFSIVYHECY